MIFFCSAASSVWPPKMQSHSKNWVTPNNGAVADALAFSRTSTACLRPGDWIDKRGCQMLWFSVLAESTALCCSDEISAGFSELNLTWSSPGLRVVCLAFVGKDETHKLFPSWDTKTDFIRDVGAIYDFFFPLNSAWFCRSFSSLPLPQRLEFKADSCFSLAASPTANIVQVQNIVAPLEPDRMAGLPLRKCPAALEKLQC